LLTTDILKFYLSKGLEVTKIYNVIEYCSDKCFSEFVQTVTADRRMGDVHPDKDLFAKLSKLIGNSGFGSLLINKYKFENVNFVKGHHGARLAVNQPQFKNMSTVNEEDEIFEIHNKKKQIVHDNPVQLGYFILMNAKLKMLQFYYDFLMKYINPSDFAFLQMDTDSIYLAISKDNFCDIIKPEFLNRYNDAIYNQCHLNDIDVSSENNWFPRECCDNHRKYDSRASGLFKLEFSGEVFYGTCSKCYTIVDEEGRTKLSCKGVNNSAIENPLELFSSVLNHEKADITAVNTGIRLNKNEMCSYEQIKKAISYFYCKRRVHDDGVNTSPLDIVLCPWSDNEL